MYFLGKFFTLLLTDQLPYLGPWGRIDWHRQVGSDRFSCFDVFFDTHRQTNKQKTKVFNFTCIHTLYNDIRNKREKDLMS